nr:uncharacterized protein LOC105330863 isoform X1 [Crassostrea gigas]XP_034318853.1 uncharacterized protein LOC105330863 isoform X1 [Crassostrea gigas]XP_034318860.1 uncharacterized protein LOC105330863 isoform X1 [Crassostrea gigas]XP_034318866.1 uncharacterized protein LOC105330863 isoform X1 [Crassostrea gigas]
MEDMLKSVMIPTVIVISFMMMNTVAVTTDNRVILSGVLVGSALVASQYGSYTFSPLEFAALTTALLVLNYPRKQTQTMKELCDSLGPKGYIWDVSNEICYHLNTIELNAVDAKRKCMSEHPNSRLLLIDSDKTYNFAVSIIDAFNTGPIYLQGTKSGPNFVDDNGQVITYFKWAAGEPGSGNYLRTDTATRLQETSSGTSFYKFICRLY